MKIIVTVKTKAHREAVEKVDDTHYKVCVRAMPQEGAANTAIVQALAKYFKIAPTRVTLCKGHRSKQKTFEII